MAMPGYAASVLLGAGLLCLGACARTYAPGPGKSAADYGPDTGRCHLLAQTTRPDFSFETQGSQKFVAISSGVMLAAGALGTVAHDAEVYDDCMQASGWVVADGKPAVVQPVTATALPPPQTAEALSAMPIAQTDKKAEQTTNAQRAAQAWLAAEDTLDLRQGSDNDRRRLYGALCGAGDRSACLMAVTLSVP